MRNKVIGLYSILLMGILVLFYGCKNDGLVKSERNLVLAGDTNELMDLFIINNFSDSVLLRKEARLLTEKQIVSKPILHLKHRMLATVKNPENLGVGIAAPQVGVSVQMVYVQRFDKDGAPFEIYFNPEIVHRGDSIRAGIEGCLSVPEFRGVVDRNQNIELEYMDSLGNFQSEKINGFTAVIFQHEIDHIQGKLYYDHVENGFEGLTFENEN